MAATVRKIQEVKEKNLSQMVDQAGEVNREKGELEKLYNELRGKIQESLPMDKTDRREVIGEEFKAIRDYPVEQYADPTKVLKYNKEIFWRLIKISVSDLEKVVPPDVAHDLIKVSVSDTPRLRILSLKK